MRRRLFWIILLGLSAVVGLGSTYLAEFGLAGDEDGRSAVPPVRAVEPEPVTLGPLPLAPVVVREAAYRINFSWLGAAPSRAERERLLRELAREHLPGFTISPRPKRGWFPRLHRPPLVPPPGFEFVQLQLPFTEQLGAAEIATSERLRLASGAAQRGDVPVFLSRELTLMDFHVRGAEAVALLPRIDAFVVAFARRSGARVRSDDQPKTVDVERFEAIRPLRWRAGVPFAPGYVALTEAGLKGGRRMLMTEGAGKLGLPELWLEIPDGVLPPRARHLLIAALAQRLVENPRPDAAGLVELDIRALRHPDLHDWLVTELDRSATGKLTLEAAEITVLGGRVIRFEVAGEPHRALCAFSGCDLTASFGPP